jgi:hypothetical protein
LTTRRSEIVDPYFTFRLSIFDFLLSFSYKTCAMGPEPIHGNLSHAMRDNYAEHGVDQVRLLYSVVHEQETNSNNFGSIIKK